MSNMETMHTQIVAGPVEFNSPTNYTIIDKQADTVLQNIHIQKGPVKEEGLNGIFIEDMLLICINQLEYFERSSYACQENVDTLRHLRNALYSTRARQYERLLRGVQGRNLK